MKKIAVVLLNILVLVVLTELIYWTTLDFFIFNDVAFENNLKILYYAPTALLAFILSILLALRFDKIPSIFRNLLFLLINTYAFFSVLQLYSTYCDETRNLSVFYSSIIIMLLISIGYFILFRILPKMKSVSIITVVIATILSFMDFLFLLIGFKVFYPEFW